MSPWTRGIVAIAVIAISLTATSRTFAESDPAAVTLWDSKSDELLVAVPGSRKFLPFALKSVFHRSFPLEFCNLSLGKVSRTTIISYRCPAFYKGEPVTFGFAVAPKPNANSLILVGVIYEQRGVLQGDSLEAFLHDFSEVGFNSFQVLLDDAKGWTVETASEKGGTTSKGVLGNLILNMGRKGYDCLLAYQSLPEFVVACSRYQPPTQTLSTTDRWFFTFNRISDTQIVLTETTSKVLNITAQGAKVNSLVEEMFERPGVE